MSILQSIGLFSLFWVAKAGATAAHLVEGDRIEAEFRLHRNKLERFSVSLRERVAQNAPNLLPAFGGPPPEPVVYGYGMLPRLVEESSSDGDVRVTTFAYSWPITQGYVDGEAQKLQVVVTDFEKAGVTITSESLQVRSMDIFNTTGSGSER
jgi:hypothetical protein